jgi:hypothetical protein
MMAVSRAHYVAAAASIVMVLVLLALPWMLKRGWGWWFLVVLGTEGVFLALTDGMSAGG